MAAVHLAEKHKLIAIGKQFYTRQWSVGTSSNYSVKVNDKPLQYLVTASGKDKGNLTEGDFVLVDEQGKAVEATSNKPSAETLLHSAIYRKTDSGAVLHTHSFWSTILSDIYGQRGHLEINGYEMLKGLEGITTHDCSVRIRIFENTQDMAELSERVESLLEDKHPAMSHAFLLRRHGIYTWGKDLFTANRHVEILEFLLEVLGRRLSINKL